MRTNVDNKAVRMQPLENRYSTTVMVVFGFARYQDIVDIGMCVVKASEHLVHEALERIGCPP